tara:strand:+ start:562 stop:1191 length:630 start_codon:yes stop_codon:yes gene_type:complete
MATYSSIRYNFPVVDATTSAQVGAGAMKLIKSIDASSDATISFVDGASSVVLNNTYKTYIFKLINIHPSDSDNVNKISFQCSTDGGSNYNTTVTSTAFRAYHFEDASAAGVGYRVAWDQAQGTAFQQVSEDLGYGNDENNAGELWLFNPSDTTFVKHFTVQTSINYDTAGNVNNFIAGYFNTTSAIDAIRFQLLDGNIDAGTIKMYGIA